MSTVIKEQPRDYSLWNERQGVFSFILLIALCLSFYAMGLYVGRWSNAAAQSVAKAELASPTNPAANNAISHSRENGETANETTEKSAEVPAIMAKPVTTTKPTVKASTPAAEKYSIQVATADTQAQADEIVTKLHRAGFESVHAVAPEPNSVAQFYAVRVGPYDVETARQVAEELQREHGFKAVQVMPRQVE